MARPHTSSKAGRPLARHKLCATGPCHEGRLVNTAAGLGPTFKGVASSGMSGAVAGTGSVARTKRTNSLDDDPFQATTPLWEHIWKSMKNSHIIWLMYVCPIQMRDFAFSWSVYRTVNKRIWWLTKDGMPHFLAEGLQFRLWKRRWPWYSSLGWDILTRKGAERAATQKSPDPVVNLKSIGHVSKLQTSKSHLEMLLIPTMG